MRLELKDLSDSQQIVIRERGFEKLFVAAERVKQGALVITVVAFCCSRCGGNFLVSMSEIGRIATTLCSACRAQYKSQNIPIPKAHRTGFGRKNRAKNNKLIVATKLKERYGINIEDVVTKLLPLSNGFCVNHIGMVCPVCKKEFYRDISNLVGHAKTYGSRQYITCSRTCNGISRRTTYVRETKSPVFIFKTKEQQGE